MRTLEVLYDGRVIDEGTPISTDGRRFKTLGEWPGLVARLREVKEKLGAGENPWEEDAAASSTSATPAAAEPPKDVPLLRMMLSQAASQSSGVLTLERRDGKLDVTYKDGKIVLVETSIPELALTRFLLEHGVCTPDALQNAEQMAPQMGGDIGGALIASGTVQPHVYFEKLIEWATVTLGKALSMDFDNRNFEPADVPQPPVPLGFDRWGVVMELVRKGLDRTTLTERLLPKRPCPVIPSHFEGVNLDDLKLKPKELRVMNAVDGVKTLGDLIDSLGGTPDKALPVFQVIFFAERTGFVVFGDDPQLDKERAEAKEVLKLFEDLQKKHFFDILGINEKSTDEETRAAFAKYAKKYHPDRLRPEAAPELVAACRDLFSLVGEAFAAVETEEKRFQYASDLDSGAAGSTADLQKVQNVLQSETHFKKAEILVRVRKYDEAMQYLEEAIKLNPEDIEFKIYQAYVGYLQHLKDANAKERAQAAIKTILALMKNQANIASGYLFLGHLNKAVEKPDVAVKYFQKVLEYDEHHQEALREVRLDTMRRDKKKKKGWLG